MKSKKFISITLVCFISLILTGIPLASNGIKDTYEWTGHVRIEGKEETIFFDTVTVGSTTVTARNVDTGELVELVYKQPTALGAMIEASNQAGFSYTLDYYPSWDSILITSIENDADYWHYYVDFDLPMVGISSFILMDENESLLLGYIEDWFVHALQIETNTQKIKKNENVTIKISNETDIPVTNATILVGEEVYHTDEMGSATITMEETGTYTIFAEKDLHIRSEKIEIQVQKSKTKGLGFIFELLQETYIWILLKTMIQYFS